MYKPKRLRPLARTSLLLQGLRYILGHWPLALVALFFISPIGPHLRLEYEYRDLGGARAMISCRYLGSRGLISTYVGEDCPIVAILDARARKRR